MSKDAPLSVEMPEAGRDNPGWIKVSVIAAVGFILGIAWPRVMGVRLGIAAPGESSTAAASASAHGGRAPEPATMLAKGPAAVASESPAPVAVPSVNVAPAPAAAANHAPSINVHKGSVLSCKTADGDTKKGKECGSIAAIDQFTMPRLRQLATCAGMEGQAGKLSVVVGADFGTNKFSYGVGKSSTIANHDAAAKCLESTFRGASMSSAAHEYPRYTIAYTTLLASSGASAGSGEGESAALEKPAAEVREKGERSAKETSTDKSDDKAERSELASGEAKVAWEVALVRDVPKTGNLVTRLPRGAKVKVGSAKDGWYQIKFGEGFANEGWVYRGAIGR